MSIQEDEFLKSIDDVLCGNPAGRVLAVLPLGICVLKLESQAPVAECRFTDHQLRRDTGPEELGTGDQLTSTFHQSRDFGAANLSDD